MCQYSEDIPTTYAIIGKSLTLPCITENKRPIQGCELRAVGTQLNLLTQRNDSFTKPTDHDLQNGNCVFNIREIERKHISTWGCRVFFKYSYKPDKSDLIFYGRLNVVEARTLKCIVLNMAYFVKVHILFLILVTIY